jgi:uncharacterized protein (DUF2235 family)
MEAKHAEYDGNAITEETAPRKGKHLILGIDGTWQAAFRDIFQSNVYRLNLSLNYEDDTPDRKPQIFIYSAGVGTANRSSQVIAGATGEGLASIILEAYVNLVANYVPGDKIYIFGFSRGAFAARALSGMISYAGLLKANSSSLIEHAWRFFTDYEQKLDFGQLMADNTYRDVEIEFLGVWDTVSGPYKKELLLNRYRFNNLLLDRCVKHGVHIISIDDSRADYSPIPWDGCHEHQTMDQIWLPGVHGDVGGGYPDASLSTISLLLMIDKLTEYYPELSFDTTYIEDTLLPIVERQDIVINDERTGFWRYFGRSVARDIKEHVLDRHAQHPLVDFLRDKKVTFKSVKKPYSPSFSIPGTGTLSPAVLHAGSWYLRKLQAILVGKFT